MSSLIERCPRGFLLKVVECVHRFLCSVYPTIICLVLFLLAIVFSVRLRVAIFDDLFGIFKLFLDLRPLIIFLVSSNLSETYASDYLFGIFKLILDIRL